MIVPYMSQQICKCIDSARTNTHMTAVSPPARIKAPEKAQEVEEYISLGVIGLAHSLLSAA